VTHEDTDLCGCMKCRVTESEIVCAHAPPRVSLCQWLGELNHFLAEVIQTSKTN
jgi:hypothetical protein